MTQPPGLPGPAVGALDVVIETERLLLKRMGAQDAPFMLQLLNEPSFIRNIGDRGVRTVDAARSYIAAGPVASYERFGFGLYLVCARDGEPMGICGLLKRDALEDPDIGFAFLPPFWSQGYAFEAASAVKRHARDVFGLRRVVAIVDQDNSASIRLLEKLGFAFERMVRIHPDNDELVLMGVHL
jgi:RimJ/RimL family protein N-acetyltransferase